MCKFLNKSMIYFLQNQLFLAGYFWAINFVNVYSKGKLHATNRVIAAKKLAFECDKSISTAVTNLHQQKPCYYNWNHICSHSLQYYLLFTVCGIPYWMCLTVKDYWISYNIVVKLFFSLSVFTITILFIVQPFLAVVDIFC